MNADRTVTGNSEQTTFTGAGAASPPRFDREQEAWVFSRYADVVAAFRSSSLVPAGPNSNAGAGPENADSVLRMRAETREALPPSQLQFWRERLQAEAEALVGTLAANRPIELLNAYARPLCLTLAGIVTAVDPMDAPRLRRLAEPISASAAEPENPVLKASAKLATAELRSCFHMGPEPLRDSGFVALAHTLPALLANVWLALIEDEQQWSTLHHQPRLLEAGMEELLRYAGLPRILFRRATADVEIGGVRIRQGERVILEVMNANRDERIFAQGGRVDVKRRGAGHLSLGAGPHACVGASLIRMALITMTRPLLERFAHAERDRPVDWKGGSVFRFPASLWVTLREPGP